MRKNELFEKKQLEWNVDAAPTVSLNLDVDINYVTDSPLAMKVTLVPRQDAPHGLSPHSSSKKQTDTGEKNVVLIVKGEEKRFQTVGTSHSSFCHFSCPLSLRFSFERPQAEELACVSSDFVVQSEAVVPRYSPPQVRPIRQSLPSDYFMENEEALKDLYDSLVKVHGFVEPKTRYGRFVKLFGGQNMDKPINWVKSVASLTYFLDSLYDAGLFSISRRGFWQSAEKCFVVEGKYKENLRTNHLENETVKQQIDRIIANVCIYKGKK